MVTKIESARKSINEGKGKSQDAMENELKEFTSKAQSKVNDAIKARNDSATILYSAAAYAFYLGIVYGRWEQANKLFKGLPPIDAEALRTRFAWRVNDKYAVDGKRIMDVDGNPIDKWEIRPTTMISYLANPAVAGQHFSLASAPEGEKGNSKREVIKAFRAKVESAGVEDLESIVWQTREAVEKAPDLYSAEKFHKSLARVLKEAAQGLSDGESGIHVSTLEAIMRDSGMPKSMRISVRAEMDKHAGYANDDKAEKTESNEGESDNAETAVAA